jgi:hypothetical protein
MTARHLRRSSRSATRVSAALLLVLGLALSARAVLPDDATEAAASELFDSLKGGSELGPAEPWPVQEGFAPPTLPDVAAIPPRPSVTCAPELVSQPLLIGESSRFAEVGGLVKGAAMSAANKALGSLLGGAVGLGGGSRRRGESGPRPTTHKDEIRKRDKVELEDADTDTRIRIGGKRTEEGVLVSTKIEDAKDKGTFHTVYLELDSCEKIFPAAYWTYELWHEWKLTVSWTVTKETYRDGELVDTDVDEGGWSESGGGLLASSSGFVSLSDPQALEELGRYQRSLLDEMGPPVWQRLGFGAPESGTRSLGTPFEMTPEHLQALQAGRLRAVVHVTREADRLYRTVSFPMRVREGEKGKLAFERLTGS